MIYLNENQVHVNDQIYDKEDAQNQESIIYWYIVL